MNEHWTELKHNTIINVPNIYKEQFKLLSSEAAIQVCKLNFKN